MSCGKGNLANSYPKIFLKYLPFLHLKLNFLFRPVFLNTKLSQISINFVLVVLIFVPVFTFKNLHKSVSYSFYIALIYTRFNDLKFSPRCFSLIFLSHLFKCIFGRIWLSRLRFMQVSKLYQFQILIFSTL